MTKRLTKVVVDGTAAAPWLFTPPSFQFIGDKQFDIFKRSLPRHSFKFKWGAGGLLPKGKWYLA